jgi:hypothetical protein
VSPRTPPQNLGCRFARVLLACAAASASAAGAQDGPSPPAADAAYTSASAASAHARAQGANLALPRQVIANGSGTSSGGAFRIDGTISQVDADPLHPATGGVYAVSGGFWSGLVRATPGAEPIFADGFE